MLYSFSGLPGVGKSTIARLLATRLKAVYIRIDTLEQALIAGGLEKQQLKGTGYELGYAIATENMALGLDVVSDCVNAWMTRDAWRVCASCCGQEFRDIEIICSNRQVHRQRLESRSDDNRSHQRPTWHDVETRDYRPHERPVFRVDTARVSPAEAVERILSGG